ncbi:hypothetical protein [Actinoplanes couchii]|uniref:Antitoxin n=1 Tax=Actinoplanes couchii TaxID=403638 RepID=A0ABQ3X0T4_9ACTN|nr:hypothetical protein [Actinoplanes couchii]MDR6316450.1 hypothetical protein [Actinoplanes couchii]GID52064.1 hypothetical protein Aco03nite_004680 [Actinoplanes couchii]
MDFIIDVPDDVAAYLQRHGDPSAAVVEAVERLLGEQRADDDPIPRDTEA